MYFTLSEIVKPFFRESERPSFFVLFVCNDGVLILPLHVVAQLASVTLS